MKNRDMFYQNMHTAYNNPGMFIPPSGYNINQEFGAYGPNMQPNDYEDRINKLERQVKNLDQRLQKLESTSESNDNFYMI